MAETMPSDTLDQLIRLSRRLGDPANDYVILGEGNTSARADAGTFWVKASGAQLDGIGASDFVRLRFAPVLALLDAEEVADEAVKERLAGAKVAGTTAARPSVETVVHAVALTLGQANFVGHTHPTAINAVLCSQQAEAALAGRLFPDEIVVCGPAPAFVPYTDPGLPLARAVRQAIRDHLARYGRSPQVILMQNHGLVALGRTAGEVDQITAMCVKTARILLGTFALGGPQFLSEAAVERIDTRPDEQYRRQALQA